MPATPRNSTTLRRDVAQVKLCVVSPCYNEAAGLEAFVGAIMEQFDSMNLSAPTLVLVDDGSDDDTLPLMLSLRDAMGEHAIEPVALSRNFGHQIALTAGLSRAAELDADVVIAMDADMQHPVAVLAEMVAEWESGAEVVLGVRRATANAGWFKRFSSKAFYAVFNFLSDTAITPGAADFYLLGADAFHALNSVGERRRLLRALVHWIGFERRLVHYDAPPRFAGESKYNLKKMVGLALDGVLAFSTRPIRLAVRFGLGLTALGLGYFVYVLLRALFSEHAVAGWGSLMGVLLILGGTQLTFIGMIGEYVARVFEESKARPLFLSKTLPPHPDAGNRSAKKS